MKGLGTPIGQIHLNELKIEGDKKYSIILEKPATREEHGLFKGEDVKRLFNKNKLKENETLIYDDGENIYGGIKDSFIMTQDEIMLDGKLYRCYFKNEELAQVVSIHVKILSELEQVGSALEEIYHQEEE